MYRRAFNLGALAALTLAGTARAGTAHRVQMFSAHPTDPARANAFDPDLLHIAPGDSVTFVPSDPSHNSASKRGMIPEGAEPWNSPVDAAFTVTLTVPGIYGYVCSPHYEMGMVGLIVVGGDLSNLSAARAVRHPGRARAAFAALLDRLG